MSEIIKDHNYWMEELKKCQQDQWYFYVNYTVDQNGNKPAISREEYYERLDFYNKNSQLPKLMRRS